ncbi:MAG TPA: AAA family ATPase, partial [Tenericutes bacterium]|nr:AAA family ATPase [Mycoplasmatota bacterium]
KKLLKEILEEIDDTTKEIQEERKEISLLEQELYELKVSCAQTEELIASKENTYQDLSRRYESITDELSGVSNILNSSIEEEEKELLDFLYENEALKSSLHKTLLIDRNTRFELTKKLEAIELDYKDKSKLYAQNEKDLKAFEIQMNRIDVKLGNMLTILNEDYNTTYERAKEEVDLSLDLDEARIKVNSIRRKLNALGEVNTLAIDQYKKVKERYDFLEKQKQDLLKAQVTLLEIIQEMDEVMVTNFKETFEKIRIEFGKTFRRLFGGGKADLKYTNPLNMLETGIEMEAEPPGKRLQHLSLLSGGEKSLTAISLLFAILKVKPIPFCLLDEVESSLDDANIARFGEFLKEFSEKTQFIVVTHRKGTMEIADLLYGVTMQESGVSKLVSVRLEEAEKYSEAKKKA